MTDQAGKKTGRKQAVASAKKAGIWVESAAVPIGAALETAENGANTPSAPQPLSPSSSATVSVPLGGPPQPGAYVSPYIRGRHGHVDTQLSPQQAATLTRIFNGLDAAGARLENGRRVSSQADVVRWWLEQVGEGEGVTR